VIEHTRLIFLSTPILTAQAIDTLHILSASCRAFGPRANCIAAVLHLRSMPANAFAVT
jgi:hypothetical protein